ncbi:MAG: glycoside hydrolase family 18 protein [Chitinophagaceae bacterium]|nr:MAG: glycoside hydrolase family 18 protein [Chitinophagaceae bacterium]
MLNRLLFFFFSAVSFSAYCQPKDFTVTAYFAGDTASINRYDANKLTHIIYSFCHLKGNRLHVDNGMDTLRIQKLVALKKKNPRLKVLLSLGGWGGCATCSTVFSTDEGRKEFAKSVKEINSFFDTDGIDLDWEYPAIEGYRGHPFKSEDKQNFTSLLVELRKSLGDKNEISFAAGGFQKFIDEAIDWASAIKLVDRVNMMTYDLVNGYSGVTGHHTALYSTVTQNESADNAINALLRKGVPANKIVIGAAFYGRMWEGVDSANSGLYQKGKFKTSTAFRTIEKEYTEQNGYRYFWDKEASAPYLYNKTKQLFVTYDDKTSIGKKVTYAMQKGLNGIMFWELSHDQSTGGLLDAINKTKQSKK